MRHYKSKSIYPVGGTPPSRDFCFYTQQPGTSTSAALSVGVRTSGISQAFLKTAGYGHQSQGCKGGATGICPGPFFAGTGRG